MCSISSFNHLQQPPAERLYLVTVCCSLCLTATPCSRDPSVCSDVGKDEEWEDDIDIPRALTPRVPVAPSPSIQKGELRKWLHPLYPARTCSA